MTVDPCSGQNDNLRHIEETLKTEQGHKEVLKIFELLSDKLDKEINEYINLLHSGSANSL